MQPNQISVATPSRSCFLWTSPVTLRLCLLFLFLAGCGGHSSPREPNQPGQPPPLALVRLSTDQFTNPESQHATEVEPGLFAFGNTIVSAFQVGRIYGGGAADIGFATSTDGGTSWTSGLLSGITSLTGGPYRAASDAVVVFDRAHNVWMIASLAVASGTDLVEVNRSSDALHWGGPAVVSATHDSDKPWIACDNSTSSVFYGHCYLQWDDPSPPANGLIWMSTSIDGGLTWSAAVNTAGLAAGLGGQPLVQPNGLVVVPLQSADGKTMLSFTSSDGGASWDAPVTISTIIDHTVAGNLRTIPLPSAAVDASGRVYVVWQDCRFRAACSSNDIVMSTSTDGSNWTAPAGIPIDAVTSTVDHFIPALAIDPATSGSSAHLGLTYYFYPVAQCTAATCTLNVGFISSSDAGATWSAATALAGPMSLAWLPNTSSGLMVADYIATTYSNGNAFGVFAVARANAGAALDQAIYTTNEPLPQMARLSTLRVRSMEAGSAITHHSDHGPRKFYDLDHEHPIPPRRRRR